MQSGSREYIAQSSNQFTAAHMKSFIDFARFLLFEQLQNLFISMLSPCVRERDPQ